MIKLDSCCFCVPGETGKPDLSKFDQVTKSQIETGSTRTYYEAIKTTSGLNKVQYFPDNDSLTFEISGKLLPIEHRQLITHENIEQAINIIKETGLIEAAAVAVIENSTVRKVDFTENIEVSNVGEYLAAISCITSQRYNKSSYQGRGEYKGKTGVAFNGTWKTKRERLLFYDKEAETKNEFYKNILRIESNRANFEAIRKDVNGENNLLEILSSDEKPVQKLFSRITGMNETNLKLYDMAINSTAIKDFMYQSLLLQAGDDMQTVRQLLEIANKGNRRSTVLEMMKRIETFRRNRDSGAIKNSTYLKDILMKLSA
jgi:hypothetical protein